MTNNNLEKTNMNTPSKAELKEKAKQEKAFRKQEHAEYVKKMQVRQKQAQILEKKKKDEEKATKIQERNRIANLPEAERKVYFENLKNKKIADRKEKREEAKELRPDILRYKNNGLSYWLCMLSIVFTVIMFIIIYKETNAVPNWFLGIDLMINIVIMLSGFMLAEKTKIYSRVGSYCSIGLGVVQFLRIFAIPLYYYNKNVAYTTAYNAWISAGNTVDTFVYSEIIGLNTGEFTWCVILMICSSLCLIAAGMISLYKGKLLRVHLKELGVER